MSDAFLMSSKLNSLDLTKAVLHTSGRTSNEAAFLYQAFVRMFGTSNHLVLKHIAMNLTDQSIDANYWNQ